jgi:hypothetical protein
MGRFQRIGPPPTAGKVRAPEWIYAYFQLLLDALDTDRTPLKPSQELGLKVAIVWMIGLAEGRPGGRPAAGPADSPSVMVLAGGSCQPTPPATTCDAPAAVAFFDPNFAFERATNVGALGGTYIDSVVSDSQGAVYVLGDTSSSTLQTVDPIQTSLSGSSDCVLAVFRPGSFRPAFVTYFGGDGDEAPYKIAVDPQGNIYLTGNVFGTHTYPATPGALQAVPKGVNDGFVVKISAVGPFPTEPDFSLSIDPSTLTATRGQKGEVTVSVDRTGGFGGNVTVTAPDTRAIKVKLTPASRSTTGDAVTFAYKVKKKAQPGTYQLTFTGRDDHNRDRSATLTLTVQ